MFDTAEIREARSKEIKRFKGQLKSALENIGVVGSEEEMDSVINTIGAWVNFVVGEAICDLKAEITYGER